LKPYFHVRDLSSIGNLTSRGSLNCEKLPSLASFLVPYSIAAITIALTIYFGFNRPLLLGLTLTVEAILVGVCVILTWDIYVEHLLHIRRKHLDSLKQDLKELICVDLRAREVSEIYGAYPESCREYLKTVIKELVDEGFLQFD
jgi:hypothetical protein